MHPALALLEFESVAAGIVAGDLMVKRGPVAELLAGTVHPGHYLVMVVGTVGDVEEAIAAGREASPAALIDEVFLPDVHPDVIGAIHGTRVAGAGEALGVIETHTVAATIEAADAGVKGAHVFLMEVNLADGLGGRASALFTGAVPDGAGAGAGGGGAARQTDRSRRHSATARGDGQQPARCPPLRGEAGPGRCNSLR